MNTFSVLEGFYLILKKPTLSTLEILFFTFTSGVANGNHICNFMTSSSEKNTTASLGDVYT